MKKLLILTISLVIFLQINGAEQMPAKLGFKPYQGLSINLPKPQPIQVQPKLTKPRFVKKMELNKLIQLKEHNKRENISYDRADTNFKIAELLYDLEYFSLAITYYQMAYLLSNDHVNQLKYANTFKNVIADLLNRAEFFYNEQNYQVAYEFYKALTNQNYDLKAANVAHNRIKEIKPKIKIKQSPPVSTRRLNFDEDEELKKLNLNVVKQSDEAWFRNTSDNSLTRHRLRPRSINQESRFKISNRPSSVPLTTTEESGNLITPISKSPTPVVPTPSLVESDVDHPFQMGQQIEQSAVQDSPQTTLYIDRSIIEGPSASLQSPRKSPESVPVDIEELSLELQELQEQRQDIPEIRDEPKKAVEAFEEEITDADKAALQEHLEQLKREHQAVTEVLEQRREAEEVGSCCSIQ